MHKQCFFFHMYFICSYFIACVAIREGSRGEKMIYGQINSPNVKFLINTLLITGDVTKLIEFKIMAVLAKVRFHPKVIKQFK